METKNMKGYMLDAEKLRDLYISSIYYYLSGGHNIIMDVNDYLNKVSYQFKSKWDFYQDPYCMDKMQILWKYSDMIENILKDNYYIELCKDSVIDIEGALKVNNDISTFANMYCDLINKVENLS